jgi:predicted  nucleic acid-binding Zn-ribbon protein
MAAVLLLGGCGGSEGSGGSSELCAQYDEIATTAEDFSELDASETSADELRSRAVDFRDRLDDLQEVVEGERLDAALSRLEKSLDAARATAAEAGDDVEERVARAEASLKEVDEKWARVQALIKDRCN